VEPSGRSITAADSNGDVSHFGPIGPIWRRANRADLARGTDMSADTTACRIGVPSAPPSYSSLINMNSDSVSSTLIPITTAIPNSPAVKEWVASFSQPTK
jgi:hypothetical protein